MASPKRVFFLFFTSQLHVHTEKLLSKTKSAILLAVQASTLTYFSTCPFGQLTKKSTGTCPTQSFSCPKKLIKITKTRE
jgi:hypothetical protein